MFSLDGTPLLVYHSPLEVIANNYLLDSLLLQRILKTETGNYLERYNSDIDKFHASYSVLNDDSSSYNKEKVKQLISEKQRLRINLNNHLPIYIHYTLASVLDSTIVFHEDIYKKEIETLEKLKKMFLN